MKYSTIGLLAILVLVCLVSGLIGVECRRIKHDQDDIHLIIQLNVGNTPKITLHNRPHKQPTTTTTNPFESPEITQETKQVIEKAKQVIPQKEEKKIATNFMDFAQKLEMIYKSLPDNVKTQPVKQQLLKYMSTFSKRAIHPTSDILKGSLNDIANESNKSNFAPSQDGASALFLGSKFKDTFKRVSDKTKSFVSKAQQVWKERGGQKIIDNIGTYADKVNNIGSKISNNVSQKLQELGFPKLANFASKMGNAIQKFSTNKLGPLGGKLKNKVIPFIKQTSGKIKETVGLIKGTISQFKVFKNVKFPKKFKDIKTSISQIKEASKNFKGKDVMEKIKGIRGNIKQLAGSFKKKK